MFFTQTAADNTTTTAPGNDDAIRYVPLTAEQIEELLKLIDDKSPVWKSPSVEVIILTLRRALD